MVAGGLTRPGSRTSIDPTLVRGLDYYTRTAFEFVSDALHGRHAQQATLFGGGRYDGLAEALGGPPTPGVGFAMGLERVLLAMETEGVAPPGEPALAVLRGRDRRRGRARRRRALVAELRAAGHLGGLGVRGAAAEGAAEDGRPRRRRVSSRSSASRSSRPAPSRCGGWTTASEDAVPLAELAAHGCRLDEADPA